MKRRSQWNRRLKTTNVVAGIIIGLLLAVVLLLIELVLKLKTGTTVVEKAADVYKERVVGKGEILQAKSDDQVAMEEMFEKNDKEGKDTRLEPGSFEH